MKLHRAWIQQAGSDIAAAEILQSQGADRCQVVAKCQQAVEKAIKALVEAMNLLGLMKMPVTSSHHVSAYATAMVRIIGTAPKTHRFLKGELPKLFPKHVRECITFLDSVVPAYPKSGELAARNTEYPFQLSSIDWCSPSSLSVFEAGDVKRQLAAAGRVQGGVSKLISAIEIAFPDAMA